MAEAEMFLMGSYPMTVDAKARVTLPSDFRRQLVPEGGQQDDRPRSRFRGT